MDMVDEYQEQQMKNLMSLLDSTANIVVEVKDPKTKEKKVGTYTIFTVVGSDAEGEFEVYRRFSDFYVFREALICRFPGCYVPPLPNKQVFGNKEDKFIEDRRQFLQYFCKKLSQLKYMYYSDEGKVFFKSKSENIDSLLQQLPPVKMESIISQYKHIFSYLSGKEINTDLILKINSFKQYLEKSSKSNLESMSKFMASLTETQACINDKINVFHQGIFPEYEKICMEPFLDAEDKNILKFNQNQMVQGPAQDIQNITANNTSYDLFNEFVKYEHKEVAAFLEAYDGKEKYDLLKEQIQSKIKDKQSEMTKLLQHKISFKAMFKSGTKEEKMQKIEDQIVELEKEFRMVQVIIDLITIILGYVEIDKFKKSKEQKYYETIEKISELEFQYHSGNLKMWHAVQSSESQKSEVKTQELQEAQF